MVSTTSEKNHVWVGDERSIYRPAYNNGCNDNDNHKF